MPLTPIYKYAWLVENLRKAGRLTFEELNQRWVDDKELSGGAELSKRTFHKWRIAAEEMFGIVIDCERKGGYHFFISTEDEIRENDLRMWLMNTVTTTNIISANRKLKDRISLESVPSGQLYLDQILNAMDKNVCVKIEYQSFWREESDVFEVEPYCVKLFKQRWYLVGRSPLLDKVMIYGLDRIYELSLVNNHQFKMPKGFDTEEYFADSYGIIVDSDYDVETVRFQITAAQAKYIRSLPMHVSQTEVESNESYSVFEVQVRPTFDFQQEMLSHIPDIEVLAPQWLKEEIECKIKQACRHDTKND